MKKITIAYIGFPIFAYAFLTLLRIASRRDVIFPDHKYIGSLIFIIASLLPPTTFSFILLFALNNQSAEDFADRVWDSERVRGMAAGQDRNEDGKVDVRERIKESAEWLNAVLRGVWPIINPDL